MGAAVFFQCDSRPLFVLENLSVFPSAKNMEQNSTYNWADLIHFRDENVSQLENTPAIPPSNFSFEILYVNTIWFPN
jgi:hypothetical protein